MPQADKVIFITGAARRVGAGIARFLHTRGCNLVLHYHHSASEAQALAAELNQQRAASVKLLAGNLLATEQLSTLAQDSIAAFGRLDGLVNNASSFFPTELGQVDEAAWQDLMGSNLKAPLFLSQALAPELTRRAGAIVGIADIHIERPMRRHIVYNLAKAGHAQLIRSLALEMAPQVRVNGVAPGVNLWPEDEQSCKASERLAIEQSIPLQRSGVPEDIARAVAFLLLDASYVTGQILAVDGGRSIVL